MNNKKYTPIEALEIFKRELLQWEEGLELTVKEIKRHALKGVNGEYEENSYLKVKQAQLEIVRNMYYRFNELMNKIEVQDEQQRKAN